MKRYHLVGLGLGQAMVEHPEGTWVKYDEVSLDISLERLAHAEQRMADLIVRVERLQATLIVLRKAAKP